MLVFQIKQYIILEILKNLLLMYTLQLEITEPKPLGLSLQTTECSV